MSAGASTTFVTHGEEQTVRLGRRMAALLQPGDVVALDGELGAGKTRFVRGLAEGLGIAPDKAHSPTYVLANVYEGDTGNRLVHVDAYRLRGLSELDEMGWDRLDDGHSIVVVEWAERLGAGLAAPERTIHVRIEHTGPEDRRITFAWPQERVPAGVDLGA